MWATQVGPNKAKANLSEWAIKFGIPDPPAWLKAQAVDRRVRNIATVVSGILLFVGGILFGANWGSTTSLSGLGTLILVVVGVAILGYSIKRARDHSVDTIYPPTVTASSPTLQAGLYVSDIRLTFASLAERHSEISMRVFNGTGRVVEFSGLSGHIKFTSPNSADPLRSGDLPTPSMRADMAQTVGPFKEWLVILSQRVPAAEADKLLAMLAADVPILFDLHGLTIKVCAHDNLQNVERLPIWGGVSYSHGNGFGQIIYGTANIKL